MPPASVIVTLLCMHSKTGERTITLSESCDSAVRWDVLCYDKQEFE